MGFDIQANLDLSGQLATKATLTFNFNKEIGFKLVYSSSKFSVSMINKGKISSKSLTGSITGSLKAVATLIPSVNVMVMGSPIRVRSNIQMTATADFALKAATTGTQASMCAKGGIGLSLDFIPKFTWMIYPGTPASKGFIGVCEGFLNAVSGDILEKITLPIDIPEKLCEFLQNAVPALKNLKGMTFDLANINLFKKELKVYCGVKCKTAGATHFGAKTKDGKVVDRCPNPLLGEAITTIK